jgi:hypothetical protein
VRRAGLRRARGLGEEGEAGVVKLARLSGAERDDATHRIVGRNAHSHTVPGDHLDSEAAHPAAQLGKHFVAGIALHTVESAGVHRDDGPRMSIRSSLLNTRSFPGEPTCVPPGQRECAMALGVQVGDLVFGVRSPVTAGTASSTRWASARSRPESMGVPKATGWPVAIWRGCRPVDIFEFTGTTGVEACPDHPDAAAERLHAGVGPTPSGKWHRPPASCRPMYGGPAGPARAAAGGRR